MIVLAHRTKQQYRKATTMRFLINAPTIAASIVVGTFYAFPATHPLVVKTFNAMVNTVVSLIG